MCIWWSENDDIALIHMWSQVLMSHTTIANMYTFIFRQVVYACRIMYVFFFLLVAHNLWASDVKQLSRASWVFAETMFLGRQGEKPKKRRGASGK